MIDYCKECVENGDSKYCMETVAVVRVSVVRRQRAARRAERSGTGQWTR